MPLVPGLSPNLRLDTSPIEDKRDPVDVIVFETEGDDIPEFDDNGDVVKIKHGDGSVTVSLDGKPINDDERKKDRGWFANLAEDIDDLELSRIADDLMRGVDDDNTTRKEWLDNIEKGLILLGLKMEVPGQQGAADGAPVEGMSRVRHPLLMEAVLRFQAQARSELLPTDGPIKIRNDDVDASVEEDQLANALEQDANHYLTVTAPEYYPDTDRMLMMLGFAGSSFKKIYFCPIRNRPVSETVDAEDIIVNNNATDLENALRITHRSLVPKHIIKRLQLLGEYRDIYLSEAQPVKSDPVKDEKAAIEGVQKDSMLRPEDRSREIYECYCRLDIKGYEHKWKGKESGLEIPYRVVIDVSSRQILSIVRNYDEDTKELPEPRIPFVHYIYVPGFGFYGIGLLNILGNTTNALTAAWRELLDAGMYACFPGALIDKGASRQNSNILRIPPGGLAQVDTMGRPINQIVMPLPYKEPSAGLMALTEEMSQTGMRIGGTAEQAVGEGKQDAQTGAILAIIEQQMVVKDSVHKRLHSAQCEEFEKLFELFREHPRTFWQFNKKPARQWEEKEFLQALDDHELVPQADPNTASQTQRVLKYMGLLQLSTQFPQIFNMLEVAQAAVQDVLKISNPTRFFNPPSAMGQPQPEQQKMEAEAQEKQASAKAKLMTAQAHMDLAKAKGLEVAQGKPGGNITMEQPKSAHDMSIEAMEAEAKLMDAHTKAKDVEAKKADILLQDANDQENRKSQMQLEQMKMAKDRMDKQDDMRIQQSQHQDEMAMQHQQHHHQMQMDAFKHQTGLAADQEKHAADLEHQQTMQKGELKSREGIAKQAARAKKNVPGKTD